MQSALLNIVNTSENQPPFQETALNEIEHLDELLLERFQQKLIVQPLLTRSLVSFQVNKTRPIYRWFKYKEAFSASLVEHLLQTYGIGGGRCLDLFAGSGTALFASSGAGLDSDGIELLPIGQQIISTKQLLESAFTPQDFERLTLWSTAGLWKHSDGRVSLPELRITRGAYSHQTKEAIEKYIGAHQQENSRVQAVLRFALLCILESVSYTRKDGQYLR